MSINITKERQNKAFFEFLEEKVKSLKERLPLLPISDLENRIIGWGDYLKNPPKHLGELAPEHRRLIEEIIQFLKDRIQHLRHEEQIN